jgi:hypothetical protein
VFSSLPFLQICNVTHRVRRPDLLLFSPNTLLAPNRAGDAAFAGPRPPAPLARGSSPCGYECTRLCLHCHGSLRRLPNEYLPQPMPAPRCKCNDWNVFRETQTQKTRYGRRVPSLLNTTCTKRCACLCRKPCCIGEVRQGFREIEDTSTVCCRV